MRNAIQTTIVLVFLAVGFTLAANHGHLPWAGAPTHKEKWCVAHDMPLDECTICNVELARGGTFLQPERKPRRGECPNTVVRVKLAKGAAEEAGLALETLKRRPLTERLEANAEVQYAPHGLAWVAPQVGGVIREVRVQIGQQVETGDVLATVESTDLAAAQADYAGAVALRTVRQRRHDRLAPLAADGIVSQQTLLDAEGALAEAQVAERRARQALRTFGLPDETLARLAKPESTPDARLTVRSPAAGVVVERRAVPGELASPERPLFAVADMDRLWVAIDVHESDLARIAPGQRVGFRVDGVPQPFRGTVITIGSAVDEQTRTTPVYAEVKNSRGMLRVHMFGRATITIRTAKPTLLIPQAAVQNDGDCNLVFIQPVPGVYQARAVKLGRVFEGGYEVLGGLAPGQQVVTTGAFLLKTELLRGQMGAG